MTQHHPYASSVAFKQSLETRIRTASTDGKDFTHRRQLVVFHRFLARVVATLGSAATLKGGLVLQQRLERARMTQDVDLHVFGSPDTLDAKLREAGALQMGDFMTLDVAQQTNQPRIANDALPYEGLRYRAECRLAEKVYGQPFGVDVVFGDLLCRPDLLHGRADLAFAGIAPPILRVLPVEFHIAEKLHAYTMPRKNPNSRVKDIPDLALLGSAQILDARFLRAALDNTFASRLTHPLPRTIPNPNPLWEEAYARMAQENELPWRSLVEVSTAVKAFLDPILATELDAVWIPADWRWRTALS